MDPKRNESIDAPDFVARYSVDHDTTEREHVGITPRTGYHLWAGAQISSRLRRQDAANQGYRWPHESVRMTAMPTPPTSTKTSLKQRLNAHARAYWPELSGIEVRYRAAFAYVDAHLADGDIIPLCRLRYAGSASHWGFAIYRASHGDYQDNYLPNGRTAGTPEDALDCAAGLYLTGWVTTQRTNAQDH